ncbi:MAG TPA: FHA domain-containing protein [Candidatus Acidoferrales bacterium]|jgi:pSer/pThr/pTyr-binding forkhead associated (FHA) protein|nr:FHA domain-containing protein [Candidatus Acidoferrales bacterium]
MPVLVVKFEGSVLQKVAVNGGAITIGRSPDNSIPIDNLAVSSHHAEIKSEQGRLVIEDLNSLNGTFVNSQRVKRSTLKDGDVVSIGKHTIQVDEKATELPADANRPAPAAKSRSSVEETFILDTEKRRKLMQEMAAAGERSQITPSRVKVATLVRIKGPIEQAEYPLTGKLTVIGKSEMATVRLQGWFKPKMAAQINRRDDGYYLGRGDRVPTINGSHIGAPTLLSDGDLIEICGVQLRFTIKE